MMDANRAEMELEGTKLRKQIDKYQSDLEAMSIKIQKLIEENESLRHDLRRSVEDRLPNVHLETLSGFNHDSLIQVQKKQIELLEQENEACKSLNDQSRQMIAQLEAKVEDLESPLKPHLMRLDMQNKLVQKDYARAEGELRQEMKFIQDELEKRSKELMTSQLHIKELERENELLQDKVYEKEDDLRNHLKKEIGYDGTFVAFQSSIDALEVRLQHAVREKEKVKQERNTLEAKLKDLAEHNHSLQEKLAEAINQLQHHINLHSTMELHQNADHGRHEHHNMHRTIDELIEQAAIKTRTAVEEVRQQYNDNLQKLMEEYNNMEAALNQKQVELDKCQKTKRTIEDELEKILQERRLNLEKSAFDNEDLAKRCFHAERERDDLQLRFEQIQQAHKMLQQSDEAAKKNHDLKERELTDRLQKTTNDLDAMTRDYTAAANSLNELKKKLSSTQNEQTSLQRRMADLVKRNEEQMIEKEKDCLSRLTQRDEINRVTFNELRNLVSRQQRMIVKYKEECHTVASQSEATINDLKQKIDNLRSRNEKLQSEVADVKRKDADMDRILTKNANRIKQLEERLQDAEEQAVEASRRVAKQLVRDRLALTQGDHFSHAANRPNISMSLLNLPSTNSKKPHSTAIADDIEHLSDE